MSILFFVLLAAGVVNIAWSTYWCTYSCRVNAIARDVLGIAASVALYLAVTS